MEKALTKYFWIINLLAIAAIAFLTASGTSELLASTVSGMLPPVDDIASIPGTVKQRRTTANQFSRRDGTDILRRNIFDSVTGPIMAVEMDDSAPQISMEGDLPIVPCPGGGQKLLSTIASPDNPEFSFATIQSGKETDLYRIGDEIEDRVVSGITWRYILLRGSSDECYIDLFGDQKDVKKAPRRAKASADDIASAIHVDGPNERTVERSVVDQALANPTQFARSVRVRPYKKNGEVVGFRLRRIKAGSPIELLGAQKGDIIHSVNGVELNSVDQALAAYQSMRSDDKLTFSITRKGKPVDLNINIR